MKHLSVLAGMMAFIIGLVAAPVWAYDFDGDEIEDILWRNASNGNTAIWFMEGENIRRTVFPGGMQMPWEITLIGDLNGDGKDDVVWKHEDGTVAVWFMNGGTVSSVGFPGSAGSDWVMQR